MLRALSLACLLVAPAVQAQAPGGPFGVNWGAQQSEMARTLALTVTKREGAFTFVKTNSLPNNLSIAETYSLIFHDKHGLQKVAMYSKDFKDDPLGSEGKRAYAGIKRSLNEKYGTPNTSTETTGLKLFKEVDEFYQCLAYSGCGMWATVWNVQGGGAISIEMKGIRRGQGFLALTYEGPQWDAAVDEHRDRTSQKDKNAL